MEQECPSERSIWLWDEAECPAGPDGFRPWLDPYPCDGASGRGSVLICPGGGYGGRAAHEGISVARAFNAAGLNAFVAHYSVAPARHPQPLRDASRALRLVRSGAGGTRVPADRVAVLGFSAGGHLAGSLGVHSADPALHTADDMAAVPNRPDALILCYPVISALHHAHKGSFNNLLGDDAAEELLHHASLELHVDEHTPPAFLWHTVEDQGVPIENSLLFAAALRRCGVPFELHLFPHGGHGLGLAESDPHVASWFGLCTAWLEGMGW